MDDLITKTIGTGTTIMDLGDHWTLKNSKHGFFEGTMIEIMDIAEQIGIDVLDLEDAICEMSKVGHNLAEFGIFGFLIFTSREVLKEAV